MPAAVRPVPASHNQRSHSLDALVPKVCFPSGLTSSENQRQNTFVVFAVFIMSEEQENTDIAAAKEPKLGAKLASLPGLSPRSSRCIWENIEL